MQRRFAAIIVVVAFTMALASFGVVNWFFESKRIRLTPAHTEYFAGAVNACLKSNSGSGRDACVNLARQLIVAVTEVYRYSYEFYQQSRFDVIRTGRYLTIYKKSCAEADTSIDGFGVNAWPIDPTAKGIGYVVSFSQRGLRIENGCLMVIELPFVDSAKFYVGQREENGRYDWIVKNYTE